MNESCTLLIPAALKKCPVFTHLAHPLPTSSLILSIDSFFLHIHIFSLSHTLHTPNPVNLKYPKTQCTLSLPRSHHLLHQFCASNHKGNFLPHLASSECREPWVFHLVSYLGVDPTHSSPEKGRQVVEKVAFDAVWKSSTALGMSRELSCLYLVTAEHQKTVFIQTLKG